MDNIDEVAAAKLFTIKKNQIKMVKRRGYKVEENEENLLYIDLKTFLDIYIPFSQKQKKSIRQIFSRVYFNENGEKLVVYYADVGNSTKQLGIEAVNEAIASSDKLKSKNLILITSVPLTPTSSKKIAELLSYNIYVFLESEMSYDPTEHYFTPEHKALSEEDQRDFLKRNNLSFDQLPIILTSDMIVRYYGFRPGQIIQINRTNLYDSLVQNSLAYRAVKEEDSRG